MQNTQILPKELAEMMDNQSGETGYQRQRRIFRWALEAGWTGKEPSVLGTYQADVAYAEAEQFLRSKATPDLAVRP